MKRSDDCFNVDSNFLYHSLMASSSDYIYLWDVQKGIFKLSPNTRIEFGIEAQTSDDFVDEWMPKIHERDVAHVKKVYQDFLLTDNTYFSMEYQIKNANNHFIWINTKGFIQRDKDTKKPLIVMSIMRNLEQSGTIDAVTSLLKYDNCKDKFMYSEQQKQDYMGTMLLLGIDDFNSVNTLNNHSFGDMVLRRTAQDILKVIPANASVYRFEGDQFLIVGENVNIEEMENLYFQINQDMGKVHELDNQSYQFTLSAGLISFPQDANTWSDLEKGINVALKKAKENGKNQCVIFTKEMLEERLYEQSVNYYLVQSIAKGFEGFHVAYQPVCVATTLKVKGAEALLRFETPNKVKVSPVEFIPLLENSQLIIPVGLWVLEQAIITCKEWIKYIPNFVMNVNVSYIQLKDAKFCDKVEALMKEYNLPVSNLTLELTESYFVSEDTTINLSLNRLKELHLQLAMDDFGTGYSSLGQLSKFNVDVIKIDRFFVQSLHKSKYNHDFVESVIRLCHNAGMRVCVEGVETREEQEIICMLNADYVQGFYVSKPMKKDEFYNYFIESPYDNESIVVSLDVEKRQKQLINDKALLNAMMNGTPTALILWNREGEVLSCNDETLELFGVQSTEEFIKHFDEFLFIGRNDDEDEKRKVSEVLKETFINGKCQLGWIHKNINGDEIPCEVTTVRIPYLDDYIVASYTRDLRAQLKMEEKVKNFNTRLKALLDASPLCLNLWNSKYENIMCNKEAVKLFDLKGEREYLDRFFELSPEIQPDGQKSSEASLNKINEAIKNGRSQFNWTHCKLNGELVPAEITLVKLDGLGEDGEVMIAGYTRDLREQIAIIEKNKKFHLRLKGLLDSTPLCLNLWTTDYKNIMCNQEAIKLFDLKGEHEYLDRFFELSPEFQPDGRLSGESAIEKIDEAIKTGRSQFNWMHCKLNGELIPSEITLVKIEGLGDNDEDMVAGYTRDLREQIAMEKKDKIITRRIRAVVDATPLACVLWNLDEEILDCNEIAMTMFEVKNKQEIIKKFDQFIPLYQPDGSISLTKKKEKFDEVKEKYHSAFEWIYINSNQEEVPCEVTLARMAIEEEEDIIVAYSRDLRELKKTLDINERLEKMAHYDSLTGCMSRVFFMDKVTHELSVSKKEDLISISFIDLDDFKSVNDTHGHKAGDLVLKAVVNEISNFLPTEGLLGRFGGDEFMIFLKNRNQNEVEKIMQKLVQNVKAIKVNFEGIIITTSISTGTTMWKGKDRNCEVLLKRADLALYEAKRAGRGRGAVQ